MVQRYLNFPLELTASLQKPTRKLQIYLIPPGKVVLLLSVEYLHFPDALKSGNITSIFKMDDAFSRKNYRPITILPSTRKVYERLVEDQNKPFICHFLSPLRCSFREKHSTQHALLHFIGACRRILDNGDNTEAVFVDLSTAYDFLNHCLSIAKLQTYDFSKASLKLIHSYLHESTPLIMVNGSSRPWNLTNHGVPQGSVLGTPFFEIYINDIFFQNFSIG